MLMIITVRSHRRAAYCYRRNRVVCLSVCLSRSWAYKNSWTDRDAAWIVDSCGPRSHVSDGVRIPHGNGPVWVGKGRPIV